MSDVIHLDPRSSNPDRLAAEAKSAADDHRIILGALNPDTGQIEGSRFLAPRLVPKAWVQGLTDAGCEAKEANVYRNGHWQKLPLVVQFSCPFDHLNETREGWAKVRLKVNPYDGWVSIHEDSCRHCTQEQIETWLLTCPRCAAGDALDEHPDHDDESWAYMFSRSDGDESPLAFVLAAMDQFGRGEALVRDRNALRSGDTWTDQKSRDWLDFQVEPNGSHVIPVEATYRKAWALAKALPGHPPKQFVEAGHRLRKGAGT